MSVFVGCQMFVQVSPTSFGLLFPIFLEYCYDYVFFSGSLHLLDCFGMF